MNPNAHAIPFVVVGLGQCGGNLASAFAARGYPVFAINSAIADMNRLEHIAPGRRISIAVGSDGAGKDPELGAEAVRQHASRIATEVGAIVDGEAALLICAGLGGGTGSASAALAEVLAPLGVPLAALVTVPAAHETGLAKVNAVRAIDALIGADIDSLLVIDNQRVFESFSSERLDRYLAAGNETIVATIDRLNTLHSSTGGVAVPGLGRMDLQRAFLAGGFTRTAQLPLHGLCDGEALAHAVATALSDGKLFAPGADLTQARFLATVICAPRSVMARMSPRSLHDLSATLKNLTSGAAVYTGAVEVPDGQPACCYAVVGGLGYPDSLTRLLSDAIDEGQQLERKVEGSLGALDMEGLDDLDSEAHRRWRTRHVAHEAPPAERAAPVPPAILVEKKEAPRAARAAERRAPAPRARNKPTVPRPSDRPAPKLRPTPLPPSANEEAEGRTIPSAPLASAPNDHGATDELDLSELEPVRPKRRVAHGAPAMALEERVQDLVARGKTARSGAAREQIEAEVALMFASDAVPERLAAMTAAVLLQTRNAPRLLSCAAQDPAQEVRRKAALLGPSVVRIARAERLS